MAEAEREGEDGQQGATDAVAPAMMQCLPPSDALHCLHVMRATALLCLPGGGRTDGRQLSPSGTRSRVEPPAGVWTSALASLNVTSS